MATGQKTGGRQKGTPNKTTQEAKDAIASAAAELGGAKRLVAWAKEDAANERIFWGTIYPKLLPLQVNSNVDIVDRTAAVQRAREEVRELFGERAGPGPGADGRGLPH